MINMEKKKNHYHNYITWISRRANTLWKGTRPTILPTGKLLGKLGFLIWV